MTRTSLTVISLLASSVVIGRQETLNSRTLLVTVTDVGNRLLDDLGPDDFVVDEAGAPRDVLSVHLADYPMVVLLDDSHEAREQLGAIQGAVTRFLARAGDRPIAIGGLATPGQLAASFDDDRGAVLAAVEHVRSANGPPMPLEAVAGVAKMLREEGTQFSAIVIVSAQPVDTVQIAAGDLLTPILDSGATVHVVANRGAESAPTPPTDVFRALADQTHGQYTAVYSPVSYSVALGRLAERLATEMMIQYVLPAGTNAAPDVRVGVRVPGARIRGLGVK